MSDTEQDGKLTATKAFFIGFFALALGWAGVLVAAVAVATEQTWSNGRPESARAKERRAGWLDTQRAWLGADHSRRIARQEQRQVWLKSGADPAAAPARPSWWRRFRAGLRRTFTHAMIGGIDFVRGAHDGWQAAQQVRRDGGTFRQVAGTRPGVGQQNPGPAEAAKPADQAPAPQYGCRNCRQLGRVDDNGVCDACTQPTPGSASPAPEPKAADPAPSTTQAATPDAPKSPAVEPKSNEGEPMAAPMNSNATVLAAKLTDINATVGTVSDDIDLLGSITTELRGKVVRAADLAHSSGMPQQAIAAVDAIQHAIAVVDANLQDFSTTAAEASSQLNAAADGLQPAAKVEDKLHRAGADGRVFDTVSN